MDDIRLTDRSTWYFGAIAVLVVFLSWNFIVFPLQRFLGGWWMIAGALIVWGILWGLFFAWEYLKQFTQPSENEESTAETREPEPEPRPSRRDLLRYLLAHPYTVEGAILQMALKDLGHETEFSKNRPSIR